MSGFGGGFPFEFGGGEDGPTPEVTIDPPAGADTFSDPFMPSMVWTNWLEVGPSRLIEQFKGKPAIEAMLRTWLAQGQDLENTLWAVKLLSGLYTSEGKQLDNLGALLGEPDRAGESDTNYRIRVIARAARNLSNGRREELLAILAILLGDSYAVKVYESYPASTLYEFVEPPTTFDALQLYQILFGAKAAGVRLEVLFSDVPSIETFTSDTQYADITVEGQWIGSIHDNTVGGYCASIHG